MALPVSDGVIRTEKEMAGIPDLTDEEIQNMWKIVVEVNNKFMYKTTSEENLRALEDEVKTRLMNVGILVGFDPTPILQGKPPILDIVGKVSTDPIHKYGFDHEKKGYEVNRANAQKEGWLGQKENPIKRKDKKKK